MKNLLTVVVAIAGLTVAFLPIYGFDLVKIPQGAKLIIALVAGLPAVLLLFWQVLETTFLRWGIVIDKNDRGETFINVARNVPHAFVKLRTRWPHFPVDELQVTLETPGQPLLDTVLYSSDGERYQFRIDSDLGYLTKSRCSALIPLAYRSHRSNNSVFLGAGDHGKRMLFDKTSQYIKVSVYQGSNLLDEEEFQISLNESGEFIVGCKGQRRNILHNLCISNMHR